MSCITPPIHPNPFLHNSIIENLQNDLSSLSWLDNIFPLAGVAQKDVNGSPVLVPCIYGQKAEGENNYIEPFPESGIRGGCFFELPTGDYDFDLAQNEVSIDINVLFWANLNLLADRDYDFTDELMASAYTALANGYYKNDITRIKTTHDRNQVFNKYGYDYGQNYSYLYPKTCFKLTLTMTIANPLCDFNGTSFNESFSPVC